MRHRISRKTLDGLWNPIRLAQCKPHRLVIPATGRFLRWLGWRIAEDPLFRFLRWGNCTLPGCKRLACCHGFCPEVCPWDCGKEDR